MSRSFKKHPCSKHNCSGMKQFANQTVRHRIDLPSGNAYKKIFPSWDISEWGGVSSFSEYKHWQRRWIGAWRTEKTEQEMYRDWYKSYQMK